MPHDNALVITLDLGGTISSKILIDTGSATNVLLQKAFVSIKCTYSINTKETTPVISFGGHTIQLFEIILIGVKACDLELETEFAVGKHSIPFDVISGRPWLHGIKAVPLIYHQCLKFMSPTGVKTIYAEVRNNHELAI